MIGSLFIYNLLKLLLLVTLIVCGKCISSTNKKNSILISIFIVIVVFSLIEGLRWDRGPDYYNNYLLLTTSDFDVVKSEPLFNAIVAIFKSSSLPYWCAFIFFSFLYIYSFTKVVKEFPKTAIWALPIMFLTTAVAHENLIRQFIAISFLLLAYCYYINNKKTSMLLCLLAIFNIHFSGLFAVALFIFFIYFKIDKYVKSPLPLVGIYLLLYFFWDTAYLSGLTSILENINLGTNSMQGYLDNADRWFTEEGSISGLQGKNGKLSLMSIAFTLVTNCIVIYFGFKAIRFDKRLRIPYWFVFIALIIHILGGDIEIYRRFAWWLYIFMPIVLGSIWYLSPMNPKLKIALASIIVFGYTYIFIMSLNTTPYSGFAFVWDR